MSETTVYLNGYDNTQTIVLNGAAVEPQIVLNGYVVQAGPPGADGQDGVIDTGGITGVWGSITGTLANQTDLSAELTTKLIKTSNLSDIPNAATARTNLGLAIGTDVEAAITPATVNDYLRGNKTWSNFNTAVQANRLDQMGIPTSPVSMGSQRLTLIANPTSAQDAATKSYVDAVVQGLNPKASVAVATEAALNSNTYSANVITASSNGALVVDDVSPVLDDRVLIKNEVADYKNGIYTVTAVGDASNPFILTRATDMDSASEIKGAFTFVVGGTVNASSGYVVNSLAPYILGTSPITFTQFSSADIPDATNLIKGKAYLGAGGGAATYESDALKAPLVSPALTGAPTAPTATAGDNSTKIATTAYADAAATAGTPDATTLVKGKVKLAGDLGGTADLPTVPGLSAKAPLASPVFTGNPTAPTPSPGDNDTSIATTAFTAAAIIAATTPDATTSVKGKVQLAGDLGGTAALPRVIRDSIIIGSVVGQLADYICNGTNDVSQINAAITAANVAGRICRALAGDYVIDGQLIPKSKVTFIADPGAKFTKTSVDTIMWRVNAVTDFTIVGGEWDGAKSITVPGATQQIIRIQESKRIRLIDMKIHDSITHGIISKNGAYNNEDIWITRCETYDNGTASDGSGVYINNTDRWYVDGLVTYGNQLDGLQWKTSTGGNVSDVNSYSNLRYAYFAVDGHTNMANIVGNDSGNQNFRVEPGEAGGNTTVTVDGMDLYNSGLDGLALVDSYGSKFSNFTIRNAGLSGISGGIKIQAQTGKSSLRHQFSVGEITDDQTVHTMAYGVWGVGAGIVDENTMSDIKISGVTTTAFRQDNWGANCSLRNVQGANPDIVNTLGNLSGTKQLDRTLGKIVTFTLVGSLSATFATGKNRTDELFLQITQDVTGGRVLSFTGSNYAFAAGGFVQSLGASQVDIYHFIWNGSLWREVGRSLNAEDKLKIANNLSDVSSTATARTNLGLAIGADVQAYNANTTLLGNTTSGTGSVVLAASPTLTGSPLAPTATAGTNTTQIATTAYVMNAISTFDDVLEYANIAAFPVSGVTNTIYVAVDTGYLYRWSGSAYVQVGGGTPADASTGTKGIVQLAGDLGGTAALPTTPTAVHLTGSETITGTKTFSTSPVISTILDSLGNIWAAAATATASAVNYIKFTNSITNANVILSPDGTDTNIAIEVRSKGTKPVILRPGTNGTGAIQIVNASGTAQSVFDTTNNRMAVGTTTPTSKLVTGGAIATPITSTAKTAAYTVVETDSTITGDTTSAAFQITLPTAVGITGRMYVIKRISASANNLTVGTTSSQTIDGVTTNALTAQYKYVTVQSDGANWIIIGSN